MAHIVIMGSGLGGMTQAYDMRHFGRKQDKITVVSNNPTFHFTPSNPWVAVSWRKRADIELDAAQCLKQKNIDFIGVGVKRVHPEKNQLELDDGSTVDYDYLIVSTGPKLAFDEIEGFGPHSGHTESICHVDHAAQSAETWERFVQAPGPIVVGAVQGASCFGPAYEYCMIMETDLRRRKIRDQVPITFVTSEPYIGHLGLGGVGDSKSMIESIFRNRSIKWICNAKVSKIEAGKMFVTEVNEDGSLKKEHELPFNYSMMLPAFKGVDAVFGIEGLTNPRGFILIDKQQRNPTYKNIYAIGVCVAIPPVEATPVPVGTPKTGFMIESMSMSTAKNIRAELDGLEPTEVATWNAICLADFGDHGAAFVAMPQIPPRNTNWFGEGKWVHYAKVAFEKYFMYKIRKGTSETLFEKMALDALGIIKLKNK